MTRPSLTELLDLCAKATPEDQWEICLESAAQAIDEQADAMTGNDHRDMMALSGQMRGAKTWIAALSPEYVAALVRCVQAADKMRRAGTANLQQCDCDYDAARARLGD